MPVDAELNDFPNERMTFFLFVTKDTLSSLLKTKTEAKSGHAKMYKKPLHIFYIIFVLDWTLSYTVYRHIVGISMSTNRVSGFMKSFSFDRIN